MRSFIRKRKAVSTTNGSTLKVISASLQSMMSMALRMNPSVKRSPNTATTPEAKSSFSVSTSLVMRVMRRPTGFLS